MKHEIYRGAEIIAVVHLEGSWSAKVMGEDIAQSSWVMSSMMEFQKGDYILKNGNKYILSGRPSTTQSGISKYSYSGSFEAEIPYSLIDTQYFMYDQDNALTLSEFSLTGKPSTFLDLLIKNVNRSGAGWSLGVVDDAEPITMTFSDDDNCRTVLTKLAEAFKTEFWFEGKKIHLTKKGNATGIEFAYGHGNGLYEVKGITPDDFQLITKLYYFGGTNNLPVGYRKNSAGVASRKLLGSARFIQADAETIKHAGIIERSKTFPDIFPKREGVITGLGDKLNVVLDETLNFDIEELKQPGLTAKISFTTGKLAGYQFEINNYSTSKKAIEFNINKDEVVFGERGLPNQYLKPGVGDKYELFDLQLPVQYVTDAETKLDAAAAELLEKSKRKPLKCEVTCSPAFIEQHKLYNIKIGDFCTITSPVLNGSVNIRIVGVTVDMQDPRKITLELADEVTISSIIRNIIEKDNIVNVVNLNKLYDVNRARRNAKTVSELQNYVVDPEGNYYPEKIRAGSIESLYLSVGAKATNFSLRGIGFSANAEGNPAVFDISAGELVHFAIDIPGVGFVWNMAARRFAELDPAKTYYVYARVSRTSLVGNWIISENVITAEQEQGFFNLQSGVLFAVADGRRDHEFTKGMTFIIGDQITAGVLKDLSGLNFFNLTEGKANFGDADSGWDWNVTYPGQFNVRGGIVSRKLTVGFGDFYSGIGDEGNFPLFIGAPSMDKAQEAKFRVSRDGTMYAKEGVFEGTITAGAGSRIGDIIIDAGGKLNISGSRVEIKPDESVRVFNRGIVDFSEASALYVPSSGTGKAALWLEKLSGITNNTPGNDYTLPVASPIVLGGIKVGAGLIMGADGLLSVNGDLFNLSNYYTRDQSDARFLPVGGTAVNSLKWNNQTYIAVEGANPLYFLGFDVADGGWKPTSMAVTKSALGLGTASQYSAFVAPEPLSVVLRNASGYVYATYLNSTATTEDATGVVNKVYGGYGSDGFIRPLTATSIFRFLALGTASQSPIEAFEPSFSILPLSKGGTGSSARNFVDFVTNESITGVKTFVQGAVFTQNLVIPTQAATGLADGQASLWAQNLSGITNSPEGDVFELTNYYTKALSDARFLNINGAAQNSYRLSGWDWDASVSGTSLLAVIGIDGVNSTFKYYGADTLKTFLGLGTIAGYDANSFQRYYSFGTDANSVPEHTNSFTYAVNAPYNGTLMHFGARGYGTQFNSNYGSSTGQLAFRARNGDAGTWYPWREIWHSGNVTFSSNANGSTAAYRDGSGDLFARYFNMAGAPESGTMGTILGQNITDGYIRPFTAPAVRGFLGIVAARDTTLQFVTNQGSTTSNSMTMLNANTIYYNDGDNIVGARGDSRLTSGIPAYHQYFLRYSDGAPLPWKEAWWNGSSYLFAHADGGSFVFNARITAETGTNGGFQNWSYSQGHNNIWRFQNSIEYGIGYYQGTSIGDYIGFHFGDRNRPLHRFYESIDGNGGRYVTSGRIESAVDGVATDPYGIISVTRGQSSNFSYYGMTRAASIGWSMGISTAADMIWGLGAGNAGIISDIKMSLSGGADLRVATSIGTGRFIAGYDSGVGGSFNANNWFRSSGNSGWTNDTYGGGIYMTDSTYVRVLGDKQFYTTNYILSDVGFIGSNYGSGLIGQYNASRYQAIFSMGNEYKPSLDGSATLNSYGILWTHANVGGQSRSNLGHQMLITEAGVTQTAIGNGIWTRSSIEAATSIVAGGVVGGSRGVFGADSGVAGSVNSNSWFRSFGQTGWYNQDYGGGIWMNDTTSIRTYGSKNFFVENGALLVTYDASAQVFVSQSGGFKSNNFTGLVGDYEITGTADKIIWTIGSNWNSIVSHYGLGYRYDNQHQIVIRQAGVVTSILGMDGYVTFGQRVVSPVVQATTMLNPPVVAPTSVPGGMSAIWVGNLSGITN